MKSRINYKYLHILSNVTYGGGEQVLINLCKYRRKENLLFLLRFSSRVPNLININNKSFLSSKNVYTSFQDHFYNFSYLIYLLFNLRFKKINFENIVLHGFPCQYSLILVRIIFPKKNLFFIFHQIKHKGNKFKMIIENLILFISKPYIGAPSNRALESIKSYVPKFCRNKIVFFLFKNCFSFIKDSKESKKLYKNTCKFLNNKPYILTVSRFEDFKGHLRLIKFIKRNKLSKEEINFVFVGDGKNYKSCLKYLEKEEIKNVFLIGFQPRENLFQIYKNSLGVFIPSYEEAFGVQIIEAQSFKKSILVFESSLIINKNVNLIDEFNLNYDFKKMMKLLAWKNIEEKNSYIFSPEETLCSLDNVLL